MVTAKVYLFIYTIMAGGTSMNGPHTYGGLRWEAQWQNAGSFTSAAACHRAAASLVLREKEYRCVDETGRIV